MTPPGFLPPDRTQATLEAGKTKAYEYRCVICGQWHVYPTPCPVRHVNEESV